MTVKVQFTMEVEVDECFFNPSEGAEGAIEAAREIMHTAPAFDGIDAETVEEMDVTTVVGATECPECTSRSAYVDVEGKQRCAFCQEVLPY